ncbi:brain protein I3-like [Mya arenaria]|uniref:brain protein I3-like n=1 Tax=Mya arenaria TaxID=6604 RepID=UPI0022E4A617|nr:brain protein I3-like [Mya arenaria]XP_052786995.1 brain protein I3-like [Mya arenaria]
MSGQKQHPPPYQPPGPGYGPPQGQQGYPPPQGYGPPPPQGYAQPPPMMAAQQSSNVVVVQAGGNTVIGACGRCGNGVAVENYSIIGIIIAIVFFPLGIICCLMMTERHCSSCGAPM